MKSLLMRMYKSKITYCHLRVIYNRSFTSLQRQSVDWEKGSYESKCSQNPPYRRQLHIVPSHSNDLFPNNRNSMPVHINQIRHASLLENYANFMTNNAVVKGCEICLVKINELSGLPWWSSVILSAFIINATIRFPLIIFTIKQNIKVQQVYEELKKVSPTLGREAMSYARKNKFSPEQTEKYMYKKFTEIKSELFIKYNCHPRKASVAELSTLPVLIGVSIGFRNLSGSRLGYLNLDSSMRCPELTTEGILWFQNLAVPDPYYILPLLLGVQSLGTLFMVSLERRDKLVKVQKTLSFMVAGFSVLFMFIATVCPSCMCLFWLSSGFFGNVIRLGSKLPQVRRAFNITKLPDESATPVKDLITLFKQKYIKK